MHEGNDAAVTGIAGIARLVVLYELATDRGVETIGSDQQVALRRDAVFKQDADLVVILAKTDACH